jgi:hypothetical protein
MARAYDCPLDDSHCDRLNECLRINAIQRDLLSKVVDLYPRTRDFMQENEDFLRLATALKARFFPSAK